MMKIRPRDDSGSGRQSFDEAFHRMFEEQFASLFRYLNRLTGDADLAEDIAQEVLVRLHQRGSMPEDTRGWMGAVANNMLRDDRRTTRRRLRLLASQPAEATAGSPAPASDEKVLADERRTAVRAALGKLSDRDRQMLILRYEGYTYREIAQAAEVAESSVGTMLIRAIAAFDAAITSAGL